MIIVLLLIIAALSLYAVLSSRLLNSVIALGAVSLLSALVFFMLRAPDVAITEAAVGAGVTTVIFVWAIRATGEPITLHRRQSGTREDLHKSGTREDRK